MVKVSCPSGRCRFFLQHLWEPKNRSNCWPSCSSIAQPRVPKPNNSCEVPKLWEMQINGWSVRALPFRKETAAVPLINPPFFFFFLQTCVLFVQFIEAIVVLVRQTSHVRITRALRCIFLVDCRYCGAVRRWAVSWLALLLSRLAIGGGKALFFFFFSPSHLEEKIYEFWFIHVFSFFSSFFFPPFSETCDRSSSPSHRLLTFFSSCFSSWWSLPSWVSCTYGNKELGCSQPVLQKQHRHERWI